ncbi:MAG: ATP-binding cassette domain-containing protein [Thermodesulfobacteriota bacterium]
MPITLTASRLKLERSGKLILDIDRLALASGETLALVGPNGAGKSTLLQVLAFLIQPDTGAIELDGEPISNGNRLTAIRRMALVFQEALLLDTTVQQNIEIPLRIRGVSRHDAQIRSVEWMHRLGISPLARKQAKKLSGGEAQRASIARALALQPQLLLMDEPFSALDYPTRKGLLIELSRILPETGITTLFVTHDFSEIPFLTRRVAVLFEGRIIREGDIQEILGEAAVSLSTWAPWDNAAISNPSA